MGSTIIIINPDPDDGGEGLTAAKDQDDKLTIKLPNKLTQSQRDAIVSAVLAIAGE